MKEKVKILLSLPERNLIKKYGYPFETIDKQLEENNDVKSSVEIEDDAYWWEQVVGNLSISGKEQVDEESMCERICGLAEEIEYNLKFETKTK